MKSLFLTLFFLAGCQSLNEVTVLERSKTQPPEWAKRTGENPIVIDSHKEIIECVVYKTLSEKKLYLVKRLYDQAKELCRTEILTDKAYFSFLVKNSPIRVEDSYIERIEKFQKHQEMQRYFRFFILLSNRSDVASLTGQPKTRVPLNHKP